VSSSLWRRLSPRHPSLSGPRVKRLLTMMSSTPSLIRSLDVTAVRAMVHGHAAYLLGRSGGRRANLSHVDLSNIALEGVDLRTADLSGARLKGAFLSKALLDGALLFGADLRDADLRRASLVGADLRGACLRGANLSQADLSGCDLREGLIALQDAKKGFHILRHQQRPGELSYAVLSGARLRNAQMNGALAASTDFRDADLTGASMNGARMCNAVLDGAVLKDAQLFQADLSGASFRHAVIVGANLTDAEIDLNALDDTLGPPPPLVYIDDEPLLDVLKSHERWCASEGAKGELAKADGVDFRALGHLRDRKLTALRASGGIFFGMDLRGAALQGADLSGADLREADLRGADLRGSKLMRALMTRTDLRDAKLGPLEIGEQRFVRTDLSGAILRYADLRGADLRRARLLDADMQSAEMEGAHTESAEFDPSLKDEE
jgi:uncharacterized protein YjbI with pentapeptide repeats